MFDHVPISKNYKLHEIACRLDKDRLAGSDVILLHINDMDTTRPPSRVEEEHGERNQEVDADAMFG